MHRWSQGKNSWQLFLSFGMAAITLLSATPAFGHLGHSNPLLADLLYRPLTLGWTVSGLCLAFLFGAGHALAPGHGKTLVAAYLVGRRGTLQQALLLGLVTTVTHTIGVFALGIVALIASQHILPEQLYPILSLASGLVICGIGFWLLDQQLSLRFGRHKMTHTPGHAHTHGYASHAHHHHPHEPTHTHPHPTARPLTPQSLVALGIAGGIVPCPSALVLLLSAVALHKIGFGLLLLIGFSLGLAVVLIGIGWMTLYARQWLDRLPTAKRWGRILPVLSAIAVIAVGGMMTAAAVVRPI